MFEKLRETEEKYRRLEEKLSNPDILSDIGEYTKLRREYSGLTPVICEYRRWLSATKAAEEAAVLRYAPDPELRLLAEEEYRDASARAEDAGQKLKVLLLPRDPNDDRNVIVEIRAGTGGDEACLFAADLFRMYSMYCAGAGFTISLLSSNETELGGIRKLVFTVEGDGAYSRFKFESGTHEVKRVPITEAQGRIHTSTATVAVMPEAEDVDIEIRPEDIIFDTCKSSGAGGQHINKTDSAVRLTYIPTGTVVECQQERSQFQNRDKAMLMLRSILYDQKRREKEAETADNRRSQIKNGDRSERIRIYRYKENLVRDMRLSDKSGSQVLDSIINGNLSDLIDALIAADTAEKMKNEN